MENPAEEEVYSPPSLGIQFNEEPKDDFNATIEPVAYSPAIIYEPEQA